ncbi:MAG TPA: L-serine ammonia-lyase [Usitatibacteraceae bacterium]|nr:L-serine ammonia-lyase [Usitatibacteraceae bacterium]
MYISLFDLFKIGIGPSSSHTVGPMRAARRFLFELPPGDFARIQRVEVELFGSLAHTGHGHGTDAAILLGLEGEMPDHIDTGSVGARVHAIAAAREINLLGRRKVRFDADRELIFNRIDLLPVHSNGMRFAAFDADNARIAEREMYSIGGGFVVDSDEAFVGSPRGVESGVPHPFDTMVELLERAAQQRQPMHALLMANEIALHGAGPTRAFMQRVREVMFGCIDQGMAVEGPLPGGLQVQRRARGIAERLRKTDSHSSEGAMNWVSAYAIAVNEENAAGGRVVTAPTNGAAGVVPAVLRYYQDFRDPTAEGYERFFLAATAVGALCKKNASISGAEVGCQGEVGSAAAMAAAGLAAALGASDAQIENAAEIALEHHLGMTCDPIGGLVQIPCIERNAMGAIKAISACSLAMLGDGSHRVTLDQAIETMRRTGADMQSKYKETSLGGLAVTVSVRQVEC